jgi:hypothetical protein
VPKEQIVCVLDTDRGLCTDGFERGEETLIEPEIETSVVDTLAPAGQLGKKVYERMYSM